MTIRLAQAEAGVILTAATLTVAGVAMAVMAEAAVETGAVVAQVVVAEAVAEADKPMLICLAIRFTLQPGMISNLFWIYLMTICSGSQYPVSDFMVPFGYHS